MDNWKRFRKKERIQERGKGESNKGGKDNKMMIESKGKDSNIKYKGRRKIKTGSKMKNKREWKMKQWGIGNIMRQWNEMIDT